MPNKLTERRRRFVEAYVLDPNATKAAQAAGYSPHTAHVQGSRLLRVANVQEAIATTQAKAIEAVGITIEWIADRLQHEATHADKPADRTRALELLGKWRGMFVERIESITYDTSALDEFSVDDLRAFALERRSPLALTEGVVDAHERQGPSERTGAREAGAIQGEAR